MKCSIMTKDEIRLKMRAIRRALTKEFITEASDSIQSTILALDCVRSAKTVMMYMSAFNEPKTDKLLNTLSGEGKRIAVPISNADDYTITPSLITDGFIRGEYGIAEPETVSPVDVSEIDVAIIPAIAFDKRGMRLGFGKGYYDKFLAEFKGVKIGVGYEFQVLDALPVSAHDIGMDIIITEKRGYNDF